MSLQNRAFGDDVVCHVGRLNTSCCALICDIVQETSCHVGFNEFLLFSFWLHTLCQSLYKSPYGTDIFNISNLTTTIPFKNVDIFAFSKMERDSHLNFLNFKLDFSFNYNFATTEFFFIYFNIFYIFLSFLYSIKKNSACH